MKRSVLAVAAAALLTPGAVVTARAQIVLSTAQRPAAGTFFDQAEPLAVAVEMAPADWDQLRLEGRSLPRVVAACEMPEYPYSHVPAQVTIGGEALPGVDVRKKGFLGSLSATRPSLRLDFGEEGHDGRAVGGARRMTLNNNRQDLTNAKQCIVYELFERAGLPAPRCGLARVSVNGEDKGFFTNVEPIDRDFVRRRFDDDGGNLYEITLGDFTPGMLDGFELKTNEDDDRSDLDRVMQALEAPDETLTEALGQVFDLDELLTFWAMESLTGHWDGMMGNRNNTFLYHDPADDRFHPIPWGTDGTLLSGHQLVPDVPPSVYALNSISGRLYAIPAMRQAYQDRLRALLDRVWDEEAIVARLRALGTQAGSDERLLAATEAFVRGRRAEIEADLASNDGRGPDVTARPFRFDTCREPVRASGAIDFIWNDDPQAFRPVADPAALQLDVPLPDGAVRFERPAQLATINADGLVMLGLVGLDATSGEQLVIGFTIPPDQYGVGEIPLHGVETMGVVIQPANGQARALIGDGRIVLTEAGRQNGERVRGRWEGFLALVPEPETP